MTTERLITRGNTIFFDFTFYDEEDNLLSDITEAEVQLTYPGDWTWETETIVLTQSAPTVWSGSWDSTRARPGWVEYHTHGVNALSESFGEDGRWRLPANRANLDYSRLPTGGTVSDYELTP